MLLWRGMSWGGFQAEVRGCRLTSDCSGTLDSDQEACPGTGRSLARSGHGLEAVGVPSAPCSSPATAFRSPRTENKVPFRRPTLSTNVAAGTPRGHACGTQPARHLRATWPGLIRQERCPVSCTAHKQDSCKHGRTSHVGSGNRPHLWSMT